MAADRPAAGAGDDTTAPEAWWSPSLGYIVPNTWGDDRRLVRVDNRHVVHEMPSDAVRLTAVPSVLAPPPVEPDGVDDGVLWWLVGAELDVQMDNTAPGRIPARFVVGGVEVDERTAVQLRDALDAAVRAARGEIAPAPPDTNTHTEYRVADGDHVPDPPVTSREPIEWIAAGRRVESRQVTTTTTRTAWTDTSTTNQPEEGNHA